MSELNAVNNIVSSTNNVVSATKAAVKSGTEFSSYMNKSASLDDIFKKASEKYNVPINLLKAVAKAESNFNPNAVSRVGAQGVMQLMPATARELGVVNSFDPEQNIMGGAKYLSNLMKKYNGDVKLTLAAYNAGSGNVKKYGGIPPFKETQNYVVKVMKYMNENISIPNDGKQYSIKTADSYKSISSYNNAIDNNVIDNISIDDTDSELELMFSYDDYLKLIDLLMNEDNEKDEQEEKERSKIEPIVTPSYINLRNIK